LLGLSGFLFKNSLSLFSFLLLKLLLLYGFGDFSFFLFFLLDGFRSNLLINLGLLDLDGCSDKSNITSESCAFLHEFYLLLISLRSGGKRASLKGCFVLHGHVDVPLLDLLFFDLDSLLSLDLNSSHLNLSELLGSLFSLLNTLLGFLKLSKGDSLLKFFLLKLLGELDNFSLIFGFNLGLLNLC
jgi:hypothetical protein